MVQNNEQQPKTLKEKVSEPILNVKQVFAIMVTLLYEVISNLMLFILMEEPNWAFIIVNVSIGTIVITGMALLRSAYPKEVPDKTIWSAFWVIWTQVVDMITNKVVKPDIRMNAFEKAIQWIVREWDIAYTEKLKEQIAYYRAKQNEGIEAMEANIETDDPNSTGYVPAIPDEPL